MVTRRPTRLPSQTRLRHAEYALDEAMREEVELLSEGVISAVGALARKATLTLEDLDRLEAARDCLFPLISSIGT